MAGRATSRRSSSGYGSRATRCTRSSARSAPRSTCRGCSTASSSWSPRPPSATRASSTCATASACGSAPPRAIYAHVVGKVEFALDEGLTGWVARTGKPAFIREDALSDPRMKYVPELEEEHFQSMVAVPVPARSGEVLGVVVLHTVAPREFDEGVLNFLVHTASLVAGAIENARLYEETRLRVDAMTNLAELSHRIVAVERARGALPGGHRGRPRAARLRRVPAVAARRRGRPARARRLRSARRAARAARRVARRAARRPPASSARSSPCAAACAPSRPSTRSCCTPSPTRPPSRCATSSTSSA